MRNELRGFGAAGSGDPAAAAGNKGGALGQPMGQPLEAPANAALSGAPINTAINANAFTGNIATDTGLYNRLLGAPERQSAQYDDLKKRLERYQTDRRTTAERAAGQFNEKVHKKEVAAGDTNKKNDQTSLPLPTTNRSVTKPAPLNVKSMAEGVNGQGLKEMLAKAETLMKEGKYSSAIDQYAAAEQVAPNQPLVWIGRANAELGAAYYSRAEAHLKQAFRADEALLMAQYDLRAFLGEDRLKAVIKDLMEIAGTDQKSPTPVFLLAYISYNTGNESKAAGYLDMAEKRAGGKDPVYGLLREHWALPASKDATPDRKPEELNK